MFIPAVGDRDPDDLRQNSSALFPSNSYGAFLNQTDIQKKIGAEVPYLECPDASFDLFVKTGDVCFLSAIFIDTIQIEFTKYRMREHGSLSWELSQTPGLKCLFGYEHMSMHVYDDREFDPLL